MSPSDRLVVILSYAALLLCAFGLYGAYDFFRQRPFPRRDVTVSVQASPDDPYFDVSEHLVQQVLDRLNAVNHRYHFVFAHEEDDPDLIVIWGTSRPMCQQMPWGIEIGVPEGTQPQMQGYLRSSLINCLVHPVEVDVE